jgi:ACS family hexuronate transporter-like MFS transporter
MAFWGGLYEEPGTGRRLGQAELAYINRDAEAPEEACVEPNARKATWAELLGCRQTWAFAFGKFMTDGIWWFFLFWLPKYLSSAYNMSGTALSLPLTVLYSMTMVGSIGGGWLPKYFIARGRSVYDARMKAMLLIAFCPLVVLLAQPLGSLGYWIPVILIGIGASAHQAWSANLFTTASDWFPKNAVGSVVGIGGLAGGIGGVLVTKLGGALFDHYGAQGQIQTGYLIMFAICATAYLAAWVVMKLLVPVNKMVELPKGLKHA